MTTHKVTTTDEEIEAALERAKQHDHDPRAVTVEHVPALNLLLVGLSTGRRLALPVEELQGLERATPDELRNSELLGHGTGIHFPDLDADLYVPALIEGVYGNRRWMAQLGRRGGRSTSEAKRAAARANGRRGGRPKMQAAQA
ncbi:MAG: DUF2442 domain-containing protein [Terracidiphilus sp.]